MIFELKDDDSIYVEGVEKIRNGRAIQRRGWVREAEAFACIEDKELWRERSGYDTFKEFIANCEPIKSDPDHVLDIVKAFRKLGKETCLKLSWMQAIYLSNQPTKVIMAIKNNKKKCQRIGQKSIDEFRKSVKKIKKELCL